MSLQNQTDPYFNEWTGSQNPAPQTHHLPAAAPPPPGLQQPHQPASGIRETPLHPDYPILSSHTDAQALAQALHIDPDGTYLEICKLSNLAEENKRLVAARDRYASQRKNAEARIRTLEATNAELTEQVEGLKGSLQRYLDAMEMEDDKVKVRPANPQAPPPANSGAFMSGGTGVAPPVVPPIAPASFPYPFPVPSARTVELADPEKFSGKDKSKLDRFIGDCGMKLLVNADMFPTEAHKIAWVIALTTDLARSSLQNGIDEYGRIVGYTTVEAVYRDLRLAFDVSNRSFAAQSKLPTIKQGHRDFAAHLADWQRTALATGFNDIALISSLTLSLNPAMTFRASIHPGKKDFIDLKEYIHWLRGCDAENRQFASITGNSHPMFYTRPPTPKAQFSTPAVHQPAPAFVPQPETYPGPGDPMDLSAAKVSIPTSQPAAASQGSRPHLLNGRVTPEESARRREQGLCSYCGDWESRKAGSKPHISKGCPLLKTRLEKQLAALTVKSATVDEAGKA